MPSRISQTQVKIGDLLVAEPFLNDPNFKRSVILLCHHDKEGSLGFILNHKMKFKFNELINNFPKFEADVFAGGPVQTDTLHFIHNVGDLLEGSVRISSGVYFGGDLDNLRFLIEAKLIEPKHIRFYLGYTGWEELQLQQEFKEGTWIPANMHANYIFKSDPELLWQNVLEQKNGNFAVISRMTDCEYEN